MSQKSKQLDSMLTRERLVEDKNKPRAHGSLEKKVYVFQVDSTLPQQRAKQTKMKTQGATPANEPSTQTVLQKIQTQIGP